MRFMLKLQLLLYRSRVAGYCIQIFECKIIMFMPKFYDEHVTMCRMFSTKLCTKLFLVS